MVDQNSGLSRQRPETDAPELITVCICTYKRQEKLAHLLRTLQTQETTNRFTYSIVVVDNDRSESARSVVETVAADSPVAIRYYCEPQQNISLARNRAIKSATSPFVAMIDDDEFPVADWLLTMYEAIQKYEAAGVLGPVKPVFDEEPPQWVIEGRFYDKPRHKTHGTGSVLRWTDTRTSNVLLRRDILRDDVMFDPAFGRGGEDKDFFNRLMEEGRVFVWCEEAPVFEAIPLLRCTRSFMLKRALLRGKISLLSPSAGYADIFKSAVAVPVYALALPLMLFLRHHIFMRCLISCCDHLGKLLAACKIDVTGGTYWVDEA
jgi:succinoglycan biosynthesis protein ExoM